MARNTGRRHDVSRRNFLAGTASAGAVTLAGCLGDDDDDVDDDAAPDDITFMHTSTSDDRRQHWAGLGERYTELTDVGWNQRAVPEGDVPVELISSIAADTLPNVGGINSDTMMFALESMDLDTPDEVIERIGEDRFLDNVLDLMKHPDGEGYYGVPTRLWPMLTQCRRSAFDEYGIDPPRTWDEIRNAAETLHDPDNDQFGIVFGTRIDHYTRQTFCPFAKSNDAHALDSDGNVVFDSDEMVEALEFYAELAEFGPPGHMDSGTIGPAYGEGNIHMYMGNSFSLWFNTQGLEEGEMLQEYIVPAVENKRSSTFGEIWGCTTFVGQTSGELQASEDWQALILGDWDISDYVEYLHGRPFGYQPVMPEIRENEEWLDHPLHEHVPDDIQHDVLPEANSNIEYFGVRDGSPLVEIGPIVGNFLIAEAANRVVEGDDAQTVAEEQADKMRDRL